MRITNYGGTFTLGRETHELAISNGPNHLHGGRRGFDKVLWKATPSAGDSRSGFILRYTSPGRLEAEVTYMLADNNALIVDYRATTTKATPVNLTQHSFFNLASKGSGESILDHRPQVNAEVFTLVDSMLIPTGELRAAAGTPFDFTEPKAHRR